MIRNILTEYKCQHIDIWEIVVLLRQILLDLHRELWRVLSLTSTSRAEARCLRSSTVKHSISNIDQSPSRPLSSVAVHESAKSAGTDQISGSGNAEVCLDPRPIEVHQILRWGFILAMKETGRYSCNTLKIGKMLVKVRIIQYQCCIKSLTRRYLPNNPSVHK